MDKMSNIPARLHSVAEGNITTGANEVLDDDLEKRQSEINNIQHHLNIYQSEINEKVRHDISMANLRIDAEEDTREANDNLLNAEINAKQLEIGAVQTDLEPTPDSPNMLPSGAIALNLGTYVGKDSHEWIHTITDAAGRIIAGIKVDGSVEWFIGMPTPVREYIESNINEILAAIRAVDEAKVDKEEGKSLIDEEFAEGVSQSESNEYVDLKLDDDDKIIEGTTVDGTKVIRGNLSVSGTASIKGSIELGGNINNPQYTDHIIDSNEYIKTVTDKDGRLLFGIRGDGKVIIPNPAIPMMDKIITKTNEFESLEDKINYLDSVFREIDSNEWIGLERDSEGNIIKGIRTDGTEVIFGGVKANIVDASRLYINGLDVKKELNGKVGKPSVSHNNNIVIFDANGNAKDSGYNVNNLPSGSGLPSGGSDGEILATDGNGNYYWRHVPTTTTTDVSQTFGVLVDQYESLNTGVSFVPAIRKAIEVAGEGGTIVFTPNKTYNIDDVIWMMNKQVIIGNGATLRRMNESKAIISSAVTVDNTTCTITFNSVPEDWIDAFTYARTIGSNQNIRVYFFSENDGQQGRYSATGIIQSISENSVTFRDMSATSITLPANTIALRSYNMLNGSQTSPTPFKIFNLIFDGNKTNNSSLLFWGINNTVHDYGHGSLIDACQFLNIPNENIVAQGIVVRNCYAKNLNGSFIHLSCPPDSYFPVGVESYMGTFVIGNYCEDIMKIDQSIMGHNLAPVAYSWNPGKLIVIGNNFYGNNTSKCILMDATTPTDEEGSSLGGDMRRAIYVGNVYENFPKIGDIPLVSDNQTSIHARLITSNIFRNCGTSDMQRLYKTDLFFENNVYDGNTVVNTGGNSKVYRIDTDFSSTPTAAALTSKYTNLPIGGQVYVTQIAKLYKKILSSASTVAWNEEDLSILN